jgi:plasmid stability protein
MAARVKKRVGTSTDRESDKIIVRLPEGMRHTLAKLAARNGRSMTAEVVAALAVHFEQERQSAAVRAQIQAPGQGSTDTKGLEDLVVDLDRKLTELNRKLETGELVELLKQQLK